MRLTLNRTLAARGRNTPPVAKWFIDGAMDGLIKFCVGPSMVVYAWYTRPIAVGDEYMVEAYLTEGRRLAKLINETMDEMGGFTDFINYMLSVEIFVLVGD